MIKLQKCFDYDRKDIKKIHGFLANQRLMQIAAYDIGLYPASRRILAILIGYADQKGKCHKSVKQISIELGISRQAVQKQIDILIKDQYITEKTKRNNVTGAIISNEYTFNQNLGILFSNCPYVFNRYGYSFLLFYHVTLLSYMVGNLHWLHRVVTSRSSTKITSKKTIGRFENQNRHLYEKFSNVYEADQFINHIPREWINYYLESSAGDDQWLEMDVSDFWSRYAGQSLEDRKNNTNLDKRTHWFAVWKKWCDQPHRNYYNK